MDTVFRCSGAAMIAVVLILTLRRQSGEMALLLSVLTCCMLLLAGLQLLQPVMIFLRRLQNHCGHAAVDAIGLFESGMDKLCDATVAVTAPADVRLQRLMKRDRISAAYAQSRIDAQPDEGWFRGKCGYILENDGSEEEFQAKCLAFLQELGIMKA